MSLSISFCNIVNSNRRTYLHTFLVKTQLKNNSHPKKNSNLICICTENEININKNIEEQQSTKDDTRYRRQGTNI